MGASDTGSPLPWFAPFLLLGALIGVAKIGVGLLGGLVAFLKLHWGKTDLGAPGGASQHAGGPPDIRGAGRSELGPGGA